MQKSIHSVSNLKLTKKTFLKDNFQEMDISSDLFELLAVLFVSHGSAGSHLLFKYPFSNQNQINFYKNNSGK